MARTTEKKRSSGAQEDATVGGADEASVAPPAAAGEGQAQVSAVAWVPRADLDREAWEAAGRKIGAVGRGSQWWIGDWIRYGNARWGEKYAEASELTGYDVGSLRNMAWVASQFDMSLRSDKLTWSHHAILAPLDDSDKREWVERAAKHDLSVSKLRSEVQALITSPSGPPASTGEAAEPAAATITCPKCGHLIDDTTPEGQ